MHMKAGSRTIFATVMAALVLVAAGCGGSDDDNGSSAASTSSSTASGKPVTLSFWSWVPGIADAVKLFNQTHPNIHVNVSTIPAGPNGGYAKMYSALKAGNAPDLAQVEFQELPSFVLQKGVVDLAKVGANNFKDRFVDWQWRQGVFGDSVYAIPQASGPLGQFYRADLFKKWGIKVPTTWDEYRQAAQEIRKHGAYIGTFPPGNSAWFTSLAWQAGGRWFGTQGNSWTVNMTDPNTLKVARFWDGMIRDKLVKTIPDFQNGWYKDLQTGKIVGWVSASWGDAILAGNAKKTKGDWRAAYLPQWQAGARVASNWGGSTTAVLTGTKHAKEALEFAVWLNSDLKSINVLIKGGYGWPAAKVGYSAPALNSPVDFFGNQKIYDVFKEADQHVDKSWGWIPTTSAAYDHLNDGFTKAVQGKGTFEDAVRTAQQQTVADLKAKGLQVAG
jgi:multiple sugar transport system substrate-binding protein